MTTKAEEQRLRRWRETRAASKKAMKVICPLISQLTWCDLFHLKGSIDLEMGDGCAVPDLNDWLLCIEDELTGEEPSKFSGAAAHNCAVNIYNAVQNAGDDTLNPDTTTKELLKDRLVQQGHAVDALDEVWSRFETWQHAFPHEEP
jgi:hypothetical protein